MNTSQIIESEKKYLLQVYNHYRSHHQFVLDRGEGVYLFDTDGHRYLDFFGGIAVNAFGHNDPDITEAISAQTKKLIHASNIYYTTPSVELAELLVENSFADKVFFGNSGAEAIEGAIKFARKWGKSFPGKPRDRIITFTNSFHGRTYGSLSATAQPKLHNGFEPMLSGFATAEFNDLGSTEKALTEETCAILVEPVQGEGGVNTADRGFLKGLREICDKNDLLLIFDEVQSGLGRTGWLFAYQYYGIEPDIMALAKPLGGGIPIGAVLMRQKIADALVPGDHGSTFGANPVACAAGVAVLKKLLRPGFLNEVRLKGEYLKSRLLELNNRYDAIKEVKGLGLLAGISTQYDPKAVADKLQKRDILVWISGTDVVRLLPPLIIERPQIDGLIEALEEVLEENQTLDHKL